MSDFNYNYVIVFLQLLLQKHYNILQLYKNKYVNYIMSHTVYTKLGQYQLTGMVKKGYLAIPA